MALDDDLQILQQRLDQLEAGPSVIGDWHRLEARAARALVAAQNAIAAIQGEMMDLMRADPPDPRWYTLQSKMRTIREHTDELRMIRMCAQSRIFEHEATAMQR